MQTHSLFANPSDQPGPSHTLRTTIATNAEEMHALPTSRAVNVYEETKALSGVTQFDISHTFELSNIHCVYAVLPPKTEIHCNVQPNVHHFVFIVHGTGGIYTESDGKALAQWDCFAFPPKKRSRAYTLVGGREGVGFVICSDKVVKGGAKLKRDPPPVPTVVSSYDSTEWSGKGIFTAKKATLTALTDLSCVPDEDRPWNAAIECLLPGTQTSHPRAHLEEEEFVFVLAGKGRYWHDGEEPGQTLIAGDCVGWKAGTGVAHSIINDADGPNGEGALLVLLTVGENKELTDKLWYPTRQQDKKFTDPNSSWIWKNAPRHTIGGASPIPRYPRLDNAPYPVWEHTNQEIKFEHD